MRTIFIFCLIIPSIYALSVCKDLDNNDVPNCNLRVHACQNIKLFSSDTYDISFLDKSVGIWGPRFVNKDKTYAGKQALVGLFNQNYGCNCFTSPEIPSTIPIGHCTITGKLCYYFANVPDLDAKLPSYKIVVTDTYHNVNVESKISSITDPTALITAFTDIYQQFQSLPTTASCLDPTQQTQCKQCIELKQYCVNACDFSCYHIEQTCSSEVLTPLGCSSESIVTVPYEWPATCGPMP